VKCFLLALLLSSTVLAPELEAQVCAVPDNEVAEAGKLPFQDLINPSSPNYTVNVYLDDQGQSPPQFRNVLNRVVGIPGGLVGDWACAGLEDRILQRPPEAPAVSRSCSATVRSIGLGEVSPFQAYLIRSA